MTEFVKLIFFVYCTKLNNWSVYLSDDFYEDFVDILVTTGVGLYPFVDNEEYGLINLTFAMRSIPAQYYSFICLISLSYSSIKSITVKNLSSSSYMWADLFGSGTLFSCY